MATAWRHARRGFVHNGLVADDSSTLTAVRPLARAARPAGIAAWRNVPVAILIGLAVLAVGPCAYAAAPDSPWQFGYSDASGHHDHAAAFELEAAPAPSQSGAPLLHLQFHLDVPSAPGPAPSRAPLSTRDRSPPAP